MIIVCAGDSFTAGAELWEEKNIPGYCNIKTKSVAATVISRLKSYENVGARLKLTFSEELRKKINCEIINLGQNGGSQIDNVQRTISTLAKLNTNVNTDLVCIFQHTYHQRVWLKTQYNTESVSLSSISDRIQDEMIASELSEVYMRFIPDQLLELDHLNCFLFLKTFCNLNDIKFIHFTLYDDMIYGKHFFSEEIIYDDLNFLGGMINHLMTKLPNEYIFLPGGHVNCDSHKLIANWLVDEMKKRGII